MQIYPAIDIKNGQCVRLLQGNFDAVTVYENDPIKACGNWYDKGATYIHIVDLDGAISGLNSNIDVIREIVERYPIPIQTGGGIRCIDDIELRLSLGVERVIIGTAAVKNPELVKDAIREYGDKVALGIDAVNGKVAYEGWKLVSEYSAIELCDKMKSYGVRTIVYTDISKDGMMIGPNIEMTKEIIEKTGINIIASGGVSSLEDLHNIKQIGAQGVIVGQALYRGVLDLSEIIDIFEKE